MFSYPDSAGRPTFRSALRSFGQDGASPLADLLTEQDIQQACDEQGACFAQAEHHIWAPALTVWALLSQCLGDCKSCAAAVARALVLRVSLGLPPCCEATGAYCKARAKLPVPLLGRLATQLGARLERQAPPRGGGKAGAPCWPTAPRRPGPTRQRTRPSTHSPRRRSRGWASP